MRVSWILVAALLFSPARARAASVNYASREITVKIVYYGPARAALEENLQNIEKRTTPAARRVAGPAPADGKGTSYLFLPLTLGEIRGWKTHVQLYTVPQSDGYKAARLLVLKEVDGIVFVADPADGEA